MYRPSKSWFCNRGFQAQKIACVIINCYQSLFMIANRLHLPALSSKFESSDDGTAVSAQENENNYT